jgi:hypothetical protein
MVTVSRTIHCNGCTITENVTADLPDIVTLDDMTEAGRRHLLAQFLFLSLPSLQPKPPAHPPTCKPPINQPN